MTTRDKAHDTGETVKAKQQCLLVKGKKGTWALTVHSKPQRSTMHVPWSPAPCPRAVAPLFQALHILWRNPAVPSPSFLLSGAIHSNYNRLLCPTLGSQGLACLMVPFKPSISSTFLPNPRWMTTQGGWPHLESHPPLEARVSLNWNTPHRGQSEGQHHSSPLVSYKPSQVYRKRCLMEIRWGSSRLKIRLISVGQGNPAIWVWE